MGYMLPDDSCRGVSHALSDRLVKYRGSVTAAFQSCTYLQAMEEERKTG